MELVLKTSIIDYDEELINDGLCVYVGITVFETTFMSSIWIHYTGHKVLCCEDNFLKLFGVEKTESLPFYQNLVDDISAILPDFSKII